MTSRIVIMFAAILTLNACHRKDANDHPVTRLNNTTVKIGKRALANFSFANAKLVSFPERLDVMGKITVTENRTVNVPARVAGRIDAIYVPSGATVWRGQILLKLFSPDFSAAKVEYLHSLQESESHPHDKDFKDLTKMARQKLEYMGLGAMDIDALSSSATQMQDLTIRSPKSGVLISKRAVLGNFVNVGDTLFTVANLNKVWFDGNLYPEDLSKVRVGQKVMITTLNGGKITGTISFISPVVDPKSHTIKIRALMDNPNLILKDGMYVNGEVILNDKQALVIPSRALTRLNNEYTVFKVIAENEFKKVSVIVGPIHGHEAAILSGLKAGDRVVSGGEALLLNAVLRVGQ